RFGQRCLNHLLRNEPAALAGEPEAVHQMRVAIWRLRSVLSAIKPMLPAEHHHWASDELRWFTRALAPARNWDIFTGDLLPPSHRCAAKPGRDEARRQCSGAIPPSGL